MSPWLYYLGGFVVASGIPMWDVHRTRNEFGLPLRQWLTAGTAARGFALFFLVWSALYLAIILIIRDPVNVLATFAPEFVRELLNQHSPSPEVVENITHSAGVIALGQAVVFVLLVAAAKRQFARDSESRLRRLLRPILAVPYKLCRREFEHRLWYTQTDCVYRAANSTAAVVIELLWDPDLVINTYKSRGRVLTPADEKALHNEKFIPNQVRHLAAAHSWRAFWKLLWKEYHDRQKNGLFIVETRLKHALRPYQKCDANMGAHLETLYAQHDSQKSKRAVLSSLLDVRGVVEIRSAQKRLVAWFGEER